MINSSCTPLNKVVMSRVVHFEIPTKHPEKTMDFYKNVFGWKFRRWGKEDYWLINTGNEQTPGINGALLKVNKTTHAVTNTINVNDLDKISNKIIQNGGKIEAPKLFIPKAGWLAYYKDVEGNIFGVMQNHKNIN